MNTRMTLKILGQIFLKSTTFFVNIGPELKLDTTNKKPFHVYLTKTIFTSFNFSLMDEEITSQIMSSLN